VKTGKAKNMLLGAAASAVACVLQIIGLVRYVGRLPDDWLGIGLYAVSAIAFAAGALGFYVRWRREGGDEPG
jgi:hypothetical protein